MKMYVVCPVYSEDYYKHTHTPLGFSIWKPRSEDSLDFAVFPNDEAGAHAYAKQQSTVNGGRELCVLEAITQYYSKPSDVKRKVWKDGELLPA